jgi:hypothetical protein
MRARIFRSDAQQTSIQRTADDPELQRPADHLRKQRDDFYPHGVPLLEIQQPKLITNRRKA